jgi:hypothetical protein
MGKVQANVDTELLKEVKKDAIDKDITIGTYVAEALVSKLEQSKAEAKKEFTNQTNLIEKEN